MACQAQSHLAESRNDGRLDLIIDFAVDNYQGHYLQFLINDGAAGWLDESQSRLPQSTSIHEPNIGNIELADFNGDGFIDIVARNGAKPPIYLNDGSGLFINLPASFLDTSGYFGVDWVVNYLPIDANSDGRIDLIADVGANTQSGQSTIFLFTQQDPGPSQTGTANADALLGDASSETLLGMGGDDVIFGAAGNDIMTGGAGADKMVGGAGADLFTDTKDGLNGDTIADFTRGDRIVITDATIRATLSGAGNVVTYGTSSFTMTKLRNVSLAATAAPESADGGPALIVSAGAGVAAITGAADGPMKSVLVGENFADSTAQSFDPYQVRFADDIFAIA